MFIVIYSTHQLLVLMEISYDESQVGSFIFKRFISPEVKCFDGEWCFYYGKVNDYMLPRCIVVSVDMST